MVKAAYSSGKPAMGVGAGNTPVIIDDTADIKLSVNSINKRVEIALTYIFGIGLKTSQDILAATGQDILAATGINPDTRARDLTEDEVAKLREYIDKNHLVEGDLRREISLNIKRLVEIGCYRGRRHRLGLPVRGQNTKNNARTRKGPKKTVMGKKG